MSGEAVCGKTFWRARSSPSPPEGEGRPERSDGRGEGSFANSDSTLLPASSFARNDPLPQGERVKTTPPEPFTGTGEPLIKRESC